MCDAGFAQLGIAGTGASNSSISGSSSLGGQVLGVLEYGGLVYDTSNSHLFVGEVRTRMAPCIQLRGGCVPRGSCAVAFSLFLLAQSNHA